MLNGIKQNLAVLLRGRWQAPAAILAVGLIALTAYRLRPAPETTPLETLLAQVFELTDAGRFHDATDSIANLLAENPPRPKEELAILHDTLATILFRQERLRTTPIRANVEMLLEHHEAAMRLGQAPSAFGGVRAGWAHEQMLEINAAVADYRAALERSPGSEERRDSMRALVRLLETRPGAEAERRTYIEALLAEQDVPPAYTWWAIQHAVQEALDFHDLTRARELVERHAGRFRRSDLSGYRDYLEAWVLVAEGDHARALPLLDAVAQWTQTETHGDAALDEAGYLPALHQWLTAQIDLNEDRPQEALHHFNRALALQGDGEVLERAAVGRLQALAALQRHGAARRGARAAVETLVLDGARSAVGVGRIRDAVRALADAHRASQLHGEAIAYYELALELTPNDESTERLVLKELLGRENRLAAEGATDRKASRALYAAAGGQFEDAAQLAIFDDRRYAQLLWDAADAYDQAGRVDDAGRLLLTFVESREDDTRRPAAMLRIGQTFAARGDFAEAIRWYDKLRERYPRLEEAAEARFLTATGLIAMGADEYDTAEGILEAMLAGERLAPEARVYRDALYELCDLLYLRGNYAQTISRIEDFLEFYPDDAEAIRLRFVLADAYRRSALELREIEPTPEVPRSALLAESRARLKAAAEYYRAFRDDALTAADSEGIALFEQLSLFYEADCLYELNEPQTLEQALGTYRQAAARYQGNPASLTAQVQIANIYVRQGKLCEATAALERARWQLGNIPDAAFADADDGMSRAHWSRYLATVASSHMFSGLNPTP